MEGNAYWEHKKQFYAVQDRESIISRIKECQLVIDKLENDELWKIILRDVSLWVEQVDSRWQDVYDNTQLTQMRNVKIAANHIKNLKQSYVTDWKFAQEELDKRKGEEIEKDYEE